ncbi:MAG TPA: PHP domain-containing protein, partial [Nocardioidaceae bacterium]|nr:PHP domain-containing protein [Nocardioidaceae bacterium]
MTDAFAHLHVASGFSLRYGSSTPAALVERAAALGQPALALTDRDGLYGAVRFVQACSEAGLTPVLGVDLAVRSEEPVRPGPGSGWGSRSGSAAGWGAPGAGRGPGVVAPEPSRASGRVRAQPVRGGAEVDPRHPRVTVLARGQASGVPAGVGWARLCRLVTRTHLSGERGSPVSSLDLVAEHALDPATGAPALVVLLGP